MSGSTRKTSQYRIGTPMHSLYNRAHSRSRFGANAFVSHLLTFTKSLIAFVHQQGTAAGISSLQTTSRKGIKESKSKLCNKPEEKRESCTLPYHEESASPCCAQSLEVAMILSNLHSGEQFDPKEDPPKATRMTGGSGEYDEDWYEDSSCDLTTGKNIGDSFDYSHDRVPQFTSPLCAKMPKFTSPTSAQQMIPLHDLQDGHGNEGSGQRKGSIRTGKWSLEEEQFVRALVSHFRSGSLNIPPGTTLRSYLAEKLDCVSPKTISIFHGHFIITRTS